MRAHDEPVPAEALPAKVRPGPRVAEGAPEVAASPQGLTAAAVLRLQRTAGNASVAHLLGDEQQREDDPSPVKDVVGSGGGRPLDGPTRSFMESRMGHDFGDVRIHTDAKATDSARSVQANAYTVGRDVVFKGDQWSPGTDSGQRTLAHELTHVVQQRAGPVEGSPAPGGIRVSDPSDRFEREADEVADRVMAGAPGSVQRQEGAEEEEEVQASPEAVQRQEGAEEEEEEAPA